MYCSVKTADAVQSIDEHTMTLLIASGSSQERDPESASYIEQAVLPLDSLVMGMFDSSDDCIKVIGRDGTLQLMNCNGRQAMEIDDFSTVAGSAWVAMWPQEAQATVRHSIDEALAGKRVRFEAFSPTAKGTPRWWEVTVAPISRPGEAVSALLASSRDITDRVQREQSLDVIAKEMRHRLRNAFAVSAAMATASARETPEHMDFAKNLSRRLGNLAEAQATLLDLDGEAPLAELVRTVLSSPNAHDGAIAVGDLPDVLLGEKSAKALAIVLGELSTNSFKYGAIGTGGKVRLSGTHHAEAIELDWSEDRGELEPAMQFHTGSTGQGATIMTRMLAAVNGEMESIPTASGYRATITIRNWQR